MQARNFGRYVIGLPFIGLGLAVLAGAIWLIIGSLLDGSFKQGPGFLVGATVVVAIFGGAFLQFGLDAVNRGFSRESRALISPPVYYLLGTFLLIPGAWSALYDSVGGLMLATVGGFLIWKGRTSGKKAAAQGASG